jgi:hypothetical protein
VSALCCAVISAACCFASRARVFRVAALAPVLAFPLDEPLLDVVALLALAAVAAAA